MFLASNLKKPKQNLCFNFPQSIWAHGSHGPPLGSLGTQDVPLTQEEDLLLAQDDSDDDTDDDMMMI